MTIWPWSKIRELKEDLDTERMRVEACAMAAIGAYDKFGILETRYHSEALANIISLRRRIEAYEKDAAINDRPCP